MKPALIPGQPELEDWRVEVQVRAYNLISAWLTEAEEALDDLLDVREASHSVVAIGSFDEKMRYGRQLSDTLHRSIETLLRVTGQFNDPGQLALILKQSESEKTEGDSRFNTLSSVKQEQLVILMRELFVEGQRLFEARQTAEGVLEVEPRPKKKRTRKKPAKKRGGRPAS